MWRRRWWPQVAAAVAQGDAGGPRRPLGGRLVPTLRDMYTQEEYKG